MRHLTDSERAILDAGGPLNLEDVDLRNVPILADELEGLRLFECCAEGVIFTSTKLKDFSAINCNLSGASFEFCDFNRAFFEGCNLSGSDFSGTTGDATFDDCDHSNWIAPEQTPEEAQQLAQGQGSTEGHDPAPQVLPPPDTLPSEVNGGEA